MTPFPTAELPAQLHQEIRGVLVDEATRPRQRRMRFRIVVPAAALAVSAVVAGAAILTGVRDGPASQHPAPQPGKTASQGFPNGWYEGPDGKKHAFTPDNPECFDQDGYHALAEAKDILEWAPTPKGYSSPMRSVGMGLWCYQGEDPAVTFVKPDTAGPAGTLDAAVLVSKLADSPQKIATWPNIAFRAGNHRVKYQPITVRSRPGVLIDGRKVAWQEPGGQWWQLTGNGIERSVLLVSIAENLTVDGTTATWPDSSAAGFEAIAVPPIDAQDHSRLPYFQVDYTSATCAGCSLDYVISWHTPPAWQAQLTESRMPLRLVTVNGRPGFISGDGSSANRVLRTTTANGAQLRVSEFGSQHTDLAAFAAQLQLLKPDDPRLGMGSPAEPAVPTP